MKTRARHEVGSRDLLIYLVGFNEIAKEFSTLSTFFFTFTKKKLKNIMQGGFPVAKNIMLSLIFHRELE